MLDYDNIFNYYLYKRGNNCKDLYKYNALLELYNEIQNFKEEIGYE